MFCLSPLVGARVGPFGALASLPPLLAISVA